MSYLICGCKKTHLALTKAGYSWSLLHCAATAPHRYSKLNMKNKKILILGVLLILIVLFFVFDLGRFFSLDALPDGTTRGTRARLREVLDEEPLTPDW